MKLNQYNLKSECFVTIVFKMRLSSNINRSNLFNLVCASTAIDDCLTYSTAGKCTSCDNNKYPDGTGDNCVGQFPRVCEFNLKVK